ncbi:MAG: hypothetical protein DRH11_13165 [Deltaproteobacteria bacterium]|nr:MAG: hypothetical protein DRH11_13165 [Deltaproteobacteria bacterium]
MRCYYVTWPDGDKDIVFAEDEEELFMILDEKASPYCAVIEEIDFPDGLTLSSKAHSQTTDDILSKAKVLRRIMKPELDQAFDALYRDIFERPTIH